MAASSAAHLKSIAARLPERLREHNLTLVAAGVAFYAFLALVPMLIAFVSIYGLVSSPEDVTRQVQDLGGSLPPRSRTSSCFSSRRSSTPTTRACRSRR